MRGIFCPPTQTGRSKNTHLSLGCFKQIQQQKGKGGQVGDGKRGGGGKKEKEAHLSLH